MNSVFRLSCSQMLRAPASCRELQALSSVIHWSQLGSNWHTAGAGTPALYSRLSKRLKGIDRGELDFTGIQLPDKSGTNAGSPKPWMPTWLSTFLTGSKAAEKQEARVKLEDLENGANLNMEGYKAYCYQYRLSTPAPRPKLLPIVRLGAMRPQRPLDSARIQYLRMCQHEKIAGCVTPSQAAEIQRDPTAAMRNKALLQALAKQSGYSVPEAQDCIASLVTLRATAVKLLKWTRMGNPMPDSFEEIKIAAAKVNKVLKQEERAKFRPAPASRSPFVRQRQFKG